MKKVLFGKKTVLVVLLALLMVCSAFVTPVSAYHNGACEIKSNGVKIGVGDIWTPSKINGTLEYRVFGETVANTSQNSVIVGVAYTYIDYDSFEKVQTAWVNDGVKNNTTAHAEIPVEDEHSPIEARGRFAINSNRRGTCKMYNYGQGVQPCEDGSSCACNY